MEHPSEEEDGMPIPLNSHGHHAQPHIIYHGIIPSPLSQIPTNAPPSKKATKYRECLKNHAASMGGNAVDGCGEFMPAGEEGTIEALTCSACTCHRNFHRMEIEEERPSFHDLPTCCSSYHDVTNPSRVTGRNVFLRPPHQTFMPGRYMESRGAGGVVTAVIKNSPPPAAKKRFRTKFTQEQKEKLLVFAEKLGWKMHKQEEDVVQQFCREIGVKRRVLKVWMHNNKNTRLANKYNPMSTSH